MSKVPVLILVTLAIFLIIGILVFKSQFPIKSSLIQNLPTPPAQLANPLPNSLNVDYMRSQNYPGSNLTIEQTLDPGSNYQRYIASYLSEGLKIYGLLTVPNGTKPVDGWPVIIFNHGYIPPEQYQTTTRYVAYVDAF